MEALDGGVGGGCTVSTNGLPKCQIKYGEAKLRRPRGRIAFLFFFFLCIFFSLPSLVLILRDALSCLVKSGTEEIQKVASGSRPQC